MKYILISLLTILSCAAYADSGHDPFQKDMMANAVVLFDNDSSVVSDTEKHRLNHVFQAAPDSAKYNINGYASEIGSVVHNLALSLRRAVAVSAALDKPNVVLFSFGEDGAPVRPSLLAARVDRKVEVDAIWTAYKPMFGYSTFRVPGPLFHLQGVEPGLQGSAVTGLGIGVGI